MLPRLAPLDLSTVAAAIGRSLCAVSTHAAASDGHPLTLGAYYRRCAVPKPEIRALARRRLAKADKAAERICRAATRTRDGGRCRIPGCRRSAQHLHHLVYRSKSKRLKWRTANCLWICRDHHALVHAGILTIRGDADGVIVVRGDVDLLNRR